MSREFVNINSLYQNLYEDLEGSDKTEEQLQEFNQEAANRAKQMARDRIAAGRNTVTGELKTKPKPVPVAKPVAQEKPVAQAAPAPQQKVVSGQGNRQMPVKTGGIQAGKAIRGGLNKLGSLAGRAVNALKNKGPIQGRQTGSQRRAQQSQAQAAPAQQAQAQTRPALSNNSPAAKAGIPLSMRQAAADRNAKFQANRRPGRTVGAPQGTGKPGSMVRAQGNQAQAKPAPQGGGGSLNQAAANIDAMRSPASGSRQVKPGLIGRLLGNKDGSAPQARPTQQSRPAPQARPTQQSRPAPQARSTQQSRPVAQSGGTTTSSPNAMGGKTTTTQSGNRTTVTNTGGTNLARDGAAETIKKYQAIQNYKKSKGLPYQRVTIGKEGDKDPFNFHYEPVGDLISDSFDITVDFLINEGHATDNSEAISIMTDPEFIAGFNAEFNESSENNK